MQTASVGDAVAALLLYVPRRSTSLQTNNVRRNRNGLKLWSVRVWKSKKSNFFSKVQLKSIITDNSKRPWIDKQISDVYQNNVFWFLSLLSALRFLIFLNLFHQIILLLLHFLAKILFDGMIITNNKSTLIWIMFQHSISSFIGLFDTHKKSK